MLRGPSREGSQVVVWLCEERYFRPHFTGYPGQNHSRASGRASRGRVFVPRDRRFLENTATHFRARWRETETQGGPHLLQLRHPPDQLGGDRVQLQEVQPVQRALQHVDDGGQLQDEGVVSAGLAEPGQAGARGPREGQGDRSHRVSPVGRLHVRAPCCTVSGQGASTAAIPASWHTEAHRASMPAGALLELSNSLSAKGPGRCHAVPERPKLGPRWEGHQ